MTELKTSPEPTTTLPAPAYSAMYRISGTPPTTVHSFDRLVRDRDQLPDIVAAAKHNAFAIAQQIDNAKQDSKAALITQYLSDQDPDIRIAAASRIVTVPKPVVDTLIDQAVVQDEKLADYLLRPDTSSQLGTIFTKEDIAVLIRNKLSAADQDPRVALFYTKLIQRANADDIPELSQKIIPIVERWYSSQNPDHQRFATKFFPYLSEKDKDNYYHNAASNPHEAVRIDTFSTLDSAPKTTRLALVNQGLDDPNITVQALAIYHISSLEQNQRAALIIRGLESPSAHLQNVASDIIAEVTGNDLALCIQKALETDNIGVQLRAAQRIFRAPAEASPRLEALVTNIIQSALDSKDPTNIANKVALIPFTSESNTRRFEKAVTDIIDNDPRAITLVYYALRQERSRLISTGLEGQNLELQRHSARAMSCAPPSEIPELISKALSSHDPIVQRIALEYISDYAPQEKQAALFMVAIAKMGNRVVESKLYEKNPLDNAKFSRTAFSKTGSETTLLGGGLKDRTIIRTIKPAAFLSWQKVYEAHQLWKDAHFDYVPVEPIQSYRLDKNGLVNVYSGVLDIDFKTWTKWTTMHHRELNAQRIKILKTLQQIGFEHGHAHEANFCLRFFRDEQGNVEFDKTPRLYLIDFDQADS